MRSKSFTQIDQRDIVGGGWDVPIILPVGSMFAQLSRHLIDLLLASMTPPKMEFVIAMGWWQLWYKQRKEWLWVLGSLALLSSMAWMELLVL